MKVLAGSRMTVCGDGADEEDEYGYGMKKKMTMVVRMMQSKEKWGSIGMRMRLKMEMTLEAWVFGDSTGVGVHMSIRPYVIGTFHHVCTSK